MAAALLPVWREDVSPRVNTFAEITAMLMVIAITPAFRSFVFAGMPPQNLMNKFLPFSLVAIFTLSVVSIECLLRSRSRTQGGGVTQSISVIGL